MCHPGGENPSKKKQPTRKKWWRAARARCYWQCTHLCQVKATKNAKTNASVPVVVEEEEDPQWVPLVGGPFTEEDEFCISIRRLQQRTGCTDATCDDIIATFRKVVLSACLHTLCLITLKITFLEVSYVIIFITFKILACTLVTWSNIVFCCAQVSALWCSEWLQSRRQKNAKCRRD